MKLNTSDIEQLEIILAPAIRTIRAVEAKSSNMASCFLELVKMAIAIKNISNITDINFKKQCIKIYNKYWKQIDILTYFLVYFLHPKYRNKGCKDKVFQEICLHAMKIWSNFNNKEDTIRMLLTQLRKYSENLAPYNMEYIENYDTPELWWSTSYERVFSTLDWLIEKKRTRLDINYLQSMAQIHSFYITNMKSELKFSKENFNEEELEATINEISEALIDDKTEEYSNHDLDLEALLDEEFQN
ncbi:zinc finger bed domain-containing protein 1-like [Gigaspora margarita]|uniref:Zinc finger bed domain-containing protein 1-like n=1 Tax=Gigaspora margarita TaxID=4874 RepID=A0A8H3XJY4_GIGMA|nr:zinc finger bed domain-containing protein 1-like [Gigaspora margarita]